MNGQGLAEIFTATVQQKDHTLRDKEGKESKGQKGINKILS